MSVPIPHPVSYPDPQITPQTVGQSVRLAGYAALFHVADGVADIIQPGAFARTLAQRSQPLPLLWQHDPARQIGWVEQVAEDRRGLRVIARIERPSSRAAHLLNLQQATGLSFGYQARRWRRHMPHGRLLDDIELLEISLVTHPLQHGARVHLVL